MKRADVVGVILDGVTTWHAPPAGGGDYDTLCGIDSDDPRVGHTGQVLPTKGQKITCANCRGIWQDVIAMRLRISDFDLGSDYE